jgi:hypothetical protein
LLVLHVCVPGSQASAVHGLPSAQSAAELQQPAWAVFRHLPAARSQLSAVHVLPSLQSASSVQQPAVGVCSH